MNINYTNIYKVIYLKVNLVFTYSVNLYLVPFTQEARENSPLNHSVTFQEAWAVCNSEHQLLSQG